ncbi:MAG: cobalamin biosynthesis protein [Candidatus Methanomethylophilaceae archaeon]
MDGDLLDLWVDAILIVLLALLLDLVVGEVPNRIHPLRWMGNMLSWLDRHIRRGGPRATKFKGFLSYLLVFALFGFVALMICSAAHYYLGEVVWIIVTAMLFKTTFAVFSFRKHCKPIQKDLENGDIEAAAEKTQMIVSRDTEGMDPKHITSSCTETVSENYVDSVVSPMTYFGIFGIIGGVMFRCANLMDAMWGYRNEKYGDLGYFPAKLDDVLGYMTARISPVFITIGAFLLRMDYKAAIPAAMEEHAKTPSPNSGWPMTAFAAALDISMEKANVYVMGKGELPTTEDVTRSYALLELSSILFLLMVTLPLYAILGIHIQIGIEDVFVGLFEAIT